MGASGGCGCGCGGCGAGLSAARRPSDYYGPRPRPGGAEYMAAPAAAQPQFGPRLSFAAALGHPDANAVGLYRIYRDGRPLYSGRAAPGTIRDRLLQHRWCLTHLGIDTAAYTVSLGPMRGSAAPRVAAAERTEIRRMRRNRVHRGTNVREGELFGPPGR